jgi:glycosyltransferase involved in cell wall biosynthesis
MHPSDELYGADRVVLEVLRGLVDAIPSRQIRCILPNDVVYPRRTFTQQAQTIGIEVYRRTMPVLRRSYLNPLGLLWTMTRLLRALRIPVGRDDLVYLTNTAMLLMCIPARIRGSRVVLHVHECWSPTERKMFGPLLRLVDVIFCVSDASRRTLPAAHSRRATVVHNGVAPAQSESSASAPRSDLRFLLASRWNAWKGHAVFLEAWELAARGDARLTILGGPPAIGSKVEVADLVRQLSRPDSVTIAGERDDVAKFLSAADFVVVPSTSPDPLPTIALEAAAAGKAVIASDTGGLPEIVVDGSTGRLVPTGDVEAWRVVLTTVSREDAEAWGGAARDRAAAEFGVERFRSRAVNLLLDAWRRAESSET